MSHFKLQIFQIFKIQIAPKIGGKRILKPL